MVNYLSIIMKIKYTGKHDPNIGCLRPCMHRYIFRRIF